MKSRSICYVFIPLLVATARADETIMTVAELAAKAQRLQTLVEQKLLRQHGMIPMLVRADDCQGA